MTAYFLRRLGRGSLVFIAALLYGCAPNDSVGTYGGYEHKTQEASLVDTYWGLFAIGDRRIDTEPGQREARITLHSHDHTLDGYTGCNVVGGQFHVDGERLRFDRLRHTKRGCRDKQHQENAMLQALDAAAYYRLQADQLILYDADERERLRFTAAQAKSD